MANPYRLSFYQQQADWHGIGDINALRASHSRRVPYYAWYVRDWLPSDRKSNIIEIAAGSGQFQHYLRQDGYLNSTGIDIDERQVHLAKTLELPVRCVSAAEFFTSQTSPVDCVVAFDILEHFTLEETHDLLNAVCETLSPTGSIIVSVPNAESPLGLYTRYSDITHEESFTSLSLRELFYCHAFKQVEFRDPWPAPVSPLRTLYRAVAVASRSLESIRIKSLGLQPPRIWSPVMFAHATRAPNSSS